MNDSQAFSISSLSKREREQFIESLTEQEAMSLLYSWEFWARKEQIPPNTATWQTWLYLAGRGAGKTRSGAEWVRARVESGRFRRIALVAPTVADSRDVMVEGESGILSVFPPSIRPEYEPSKRKITFHNGAVAYLYSADKPERLRGPQHDTAWADELAAWRYPMAWDMLMFGLRLGQQPQAIVTTTPKPKRVIRELLKESTTYVTKGSTRDNIANLAPSFIEYIFNKYDGTTLGRQELDAEVLEEQPGALWQRKNIQRARTHPQLARVVVGIDPNVTSSDEADECGIVVAGLGIDGKAYVLQDYSGRMGPNEWAKKAVYAYHHHRADRIVPEVNNGGELVLIVIRTVDNNVPITPVHASRGKVTRAEPVAALYEQGRVLHVGMHEDLEDQMCTWVPGEDDSPDRIDALVWAISFLMLSETPKGDQLIEYEEHVNISPF